MVCVPYSCYSACSACMCRAYVDQVQPRSCSAYYRPRTNCLRSLHRHGYVLHRKFLFQNAQCLYSFYIEHHYHHDIFPVLIGPYYATEYMDVAFSHLQDIACPHYAIACHHGQLGHVADYSDAAICCLSLRLQHSSTGFPSM